MQEYSLEEYFAAWDPMGFIKDGAEPDEYSSEAREVRLGFQKQMTTRAVGRLVYDVFRGSFEIDPDGLQEQCEIRAAEIKEMIEQTTQSNAGDKMI